MSKEVVGYGARRALLGNPGEEMMAMQALDRAAGVTDVGTGSITLAGQ